MTRYQVYQKDFSGRWFPLHAQEFSTPAEALAVVERMSEGDPSRRQHFKIKRVSHS